MKTEFENFRNTTIRQIRIWAWIAAVLPLTSLAGLFFIWTFGSDTILSKAMVVGETAMFGVAVIWWWWAIFVINKLVRQWEITRSNVSDVLLELKTIKGIVQDVIPAENDK